MARCVDACERKMTMSTLQAVALRASSDFDAAANDTPYSSVYDFACKENEEWSSLLVEGQNNLSVRIGSILPKNKSSFVIVIPLSLNGASLCQVSLPYVDEGGEFPVLKMAKVTTRHYSFDVSPHMLVDWLRHPFVVALARSQPSLVNNFFHNYIPHNY